MFFFIDLNISVPFITIYKLLLAQGDKISVLNRQLSLNVSGHTKRPAGTTGTLNKRPQNIFNHNLLKLKKSVNIFKIFLVEFILF